MTEEKAIRIIEIWESEGTFHSSETTDEYCTAKGFLEGLEQERQHSERLAFVLDQSNKRLKTFKDSDESDVININNTTLAAYRERRK